MTSGCGQLCGRGLAPNGAVNLRHRFVFAAFGEPAGTPPRSLAEESVIPPAATARPTRVTGLLPTRSFQGRRVAPKAMPASPLPRGTPRPSCRTHRMPHCGVGRYRSPHRRGQQPLSRAVRPSGPCIRVDYRRQWPVARPGHEHLRRSLGPCSPSPGNPVSRSTRRPPPTGLATSVTIRAPARRDHRRAASGQWPPGTDERPLKSR